MAQPKAINAAWADRVLRWVEPLIYGPRSRWTHALLIVLTLVFAVQAARLQPEAGWLRSMPLTHPYMETFREYYGDFGSANTLLVALVTDEGDIYTPAFMQALQQATEELFYMPGVDRTRTQSLFTPNVSYVETVEDGLSGATVVPADYTPTPQMLARIRSNVAKANILGRLVTRDQRGAMIMTELLDRDPRTGKPLDYAEIGQQLEALRARYETAHLKVHIVGYAKVVDEMTRGALQVGGFFVLALLLTGVLLWLYCGSLKLALVPLASSLVAVIWELGLLRTLGYGLDPFAVLVPFLILAVSVSHGVQYVNAWGSEVQGGHGSHGASLETFRRLAVAGTVALLTDVAGFATLYLIPIQAIREMSINAMLGGFAIIIANKLLVPIWLRYVRLRNPVAFAARQQRQDAALNGLWWKLSAVTRRPLATVVIGVSLLLLGVALWGRQGLAIGDVQRGVPELRPESRLNQDFNAVTDHFDIAMDQLKVIAESHADGCVDYEAMAQIDRFAWHMDNVDGVRSTLSLLTAAKLVYQGLSEGRLNALTLPRRPQALAQATALVPTSTGLLTDSCDALVVYVFTRDHRAETIAQVIDEAKRFDASNRSDFYARHPESNAAACDQQHTLFRQLRAASRDTLSAMQAGDASAARAHQAELQSRYDAIDQACPVTFALASGNLGAMAATNEVIRAEEGRVLLWVYAVILALLWACFRGWRALLCIALPLALVSQLSYAVMAALGIGLKVATLPVLALAVGIGVDYGIYVYGVFAAGLAQGLDVRRAWFETLRGTGKAVIFTGLTLAAAVATWLLSSLQFQADMGLLLLFMFSANMIGAVLLLPALAAWLFRDKKAS